MSSGSPRYAACLQGLQSRWSLSTPGPAIAGRRWPPEKFAAVGDVLSGAGAHTLVMGTEEEQPLVAAVVEAMKAEAVSLCGRLSIGGLAWLLSQCAVVVANDSGPVDLAEAAGAATIGIYWCGNVINGGPLSRTRHRAALSWRLACPICGLNCMSARCEHSASFVAEVAVDEVLAAALDLLRAHRATLHDAASRSRRPCPRLLALTKEVYNQWWRSVHLEMAVVPNALRVADCQILAAFA
jgi:ADP-heptose:LPS heptosyltransferase